MGVGVAEEVAREAAGGREEVAVDQRDLGGAGRDGHAPRCRASARPPKPARAQVASARGEVGPGAAEVDRAVLVGQRGRDEAGARPVGLGDQAAQPARRLGQRGGLPDEDARRVGRGDAGVEAGGQRGVVGDDDQLAGQAVEAEGVVERAADLGRGRGGRRRG